MIKRVVSIDVLRAVAITGMIFCASIGWNSNLPGWMFHAQTPPPDYVFDPSHVGITWVDLVFPFFIFSMGAALSFSIFGKFKKGGSGLAVFWGILHRWVSLVLFSILLGNASALGTSVRPAAEINVFRIFIWVAFFLTFIRLSSSKRWVGPLVNFSGLLLLFVEVFVSVRYFGVDFSLYSSDIILLILANLVLWGGLVMLLTRNKPMVRIALLCILVFFKFVADCNSRFMDCFPEPEWLSWLFRWSFLQYLVIIIPATLIGDLMIAAFSEARPSFQEPPSRICCREIVPCLIILFATLLQLWGLYGRHVWVDLALSVLLAAVFFVIKGKSSSLWQRIASLGFPVLVIGIVLDPIDGGITKDPCNLSYLAVTCGMAMLVTAFLLFLEERRLLGQGFLSGVGQNPMVAYTGASFVVVPLFSLLGVAGPFDALTVGSPFFGLLRGVIITFFVLLLTFFLSRRCLYWKS